MTSMPHLTNSDDVINDVTDDSEPDFVDVRDFGKVSEAKIKNEERHVTSQTPEICVNNIPITLTDSDDIIKVKRIETGRSSLKSSLTRLKDEEDGRKRTISFDLHESLPKIEVTDEPSKNDSLRNLFTSSRWSTSESTESESETNDQHSKSTDDVIISVTSMNDLAQKKKAHQAMFNKSKSLKAVATRKTSVDVIFRRRHSTGDEVAKQATALRDSAIDLISDEENSEVYTAVSLAGTLKRGAQPVQHTGIKRKYVIIGASVGSLVAITIIVVLSVLLLQKQ